jgi:hypothetical protein
MRNVLIYFDLPTRRRVFGHVRRRLRPGALMVLGSAGADYFAQRDIPVEAAARDEYPLWPPSDCPLCAAGVPLENVAATTTGDDETGA